MLRLGILVAGLSLGSPTDVAARQLGLTTQDANGFHMLNISEHDGIAMAAVWFKSREGELERREVLYPPKVFEKNWRLIEGGALDPYLARPGTEDLGVAFNYVVVLDPELSEDRKEHRTYLIPKCHAPREIKEIVDGMALDLLPEGSPGLFEPCDD